MHKVYDDLYSRGSKQTMRLQVEFLQWARVLEHDTFSQAVRQVCLSPQSFQCKSDRDSFNLSKHGICFLRTFIYWVLSQKFADLLYHI